jgi:hypothetical protein
VRPRPEASGAAGSGRPHARVNIVAGMGDTVQHDLDGRKLEAPPRDRAIDVVVLGRNRPIDTDTQVLDVLRGLGCDARFVARDEIDPSPESLLWLRGTATWYRKALAAVASMPQRDRPPVILWHTEALPFSRASGRRQPRLQACEVVRIARRNDRRVDPRSNVRSLRRVLDDGVLSLLCVSMPAGQAYLAEQGIESEFVPIGYHRDHGRDLSLDRDIDVLFIGDLGVARRRRAFRLLRRAGVRLEAVGSLTDERYWGEHRTRLLNRARVMLNIPRYPGQLSGKRLILGMANKALVVSEPADMSGPYESGRHYVEATIDETPDVITRYLSDDAACDRIVESAHSFVTRELTPERSVRRVLTLAGERLATR